MKAKRGHDADRALIFNIQRFSLHDGPGIRTSVFVKGCPLRCFWCANPESQDPAAQLIVRNGRCKACGACVDVCPSDALRMNGLGVREIDWERCDHCLMCVDACIYGCMNRCGEALGIDEVVAEVMRDEAFYSNSGGGVTLSGGEPLLHGEFPTRLLEALKNRGLHTAVDTSGHVSWSIIASVLPFVDLLLWDVKHLDPSKHQEATGVANDRILRNLEAASNRTRIWLRLPLIQGYNDDVEHVLQLARLGRRIRAEKISLLPYHEGGRVKSGQIGRAEPSPRARAPSREAIDVLRHTLEREGMVVGVGN